MDLLATGKKLVEGLDQRMSPSLYDAAWLLRLRDTDGEQEYPHYLEWILFKQHPNGSWGSPIRYYHHDRIICTLIASIAIYESRQSDETRRALKRAENFLWQNLHLVFRDSALTELVGFELLFPTLMLEARKLGMRMPAHNFGVSNLKVEKLRLIPPDLLYSNTLSTVHSLEFLGSNVRVENLHEAVFENGSLGNSPATTAYYIRLCRQRGVSYLPEARDYLSRVSSVYDPSIYLYPFRNFERLWVINNLLQTDHADTFLSLVDDEFLDDLERSLGSDGIGLDEEFGIADADCTSVACCLLALSGRTVDPTVLARYEIPGERIFRTYFFERNPSVSTNIHALEAIRLMPDYPDRAVVMRKIEDMLFSSRRFNLFWTDKWHASPYYATANALATLLDPDLPVHPGYLDTIEWMVHNQRENGSWGYFDEGTPEETAYALYALQKAYRFGLVPQDILQRGTDYLLARAGVEDPGSEYVELWLGKCLYAPYDIIRSAILTALLRHEQLFGRLG